MLLRTPRNVVPGRFEGARHFIAMDPRGHLASEESDGTISSLSPEAGSSDPERPPGGSAWDRSAHYLLVKLALLTLLGRPSDKLLAGTGLGLMVFVAFLAILVPEPASFPLVLFTALFSMGGAAFLVSLPGTIAIRMNPGLKNPNVRASGAVAIFLLLFYLLTRFL